MSHRLTLNFIGPTLQFIKSMIGISTPPSSNLTKRKSKQEKIVYKLTKTAFMKFRPQRVSRIQETSSTGLFSRFKSLVSFRGSSRNETLRNSSKQKIQGDTSRASNFEQLNYLFILDADSYLIGNKTQLDAISISLVEDYIQAEHLWTFKLKWPILHLLVDSKRKSIIAVVQGQILLFGYQSRKSKTPPQLLKEFKLLDEVRMVQFAKDSLLAVFFEHYASFYLIDGQSSRQFSKKEYKTSKNLLLYRSSLCVEGILNLFFTETKLNDQSPKPLFTLWCLPFDFSGVNCQIGQIKSIYNVQQRFRQSLKIESIAKDCFLMNLGKEIYMFKKGYCVDKVAVNFHDNNTVLKYFSDRKLVHVAPTQIDFYNVVIDLAANPPKIQLKSTDSIVVPERKGKYLFMDLLRFQEHKLGFFYQTPSANLTGEVKYEFVLTSLWDYDQKVNSLLPKVNSFKGERNSENPQFQAFMQLIEQRCDSVAKMGMSRKQAYLHIWRESGKNSVQEFKLLLDTLDYNTIREEITLKLKSKSMMWVQVHKIQQGCLGLLSDSLFSQSNFTPQGLKNYLISHFLIRKLEMFKQIKLYQKKANKIKQSDLARQGKTFMINIQQYTTTIQMDIKAHLLDLIYNLCKNKKDLVTQIRIIIKKFRFPLRHIYPTLIKDIVGLAKEELHQLLVKIPQILPYIPASEHEHQTTQGPSLHGVWGGLTDEQWQRALYLGQVSTVFNRDMINQLSLTVWTKRNWLTYHDMIFLSRAEIESQFLQVEQSIYYGLLEHIFSHFKSEEKLKVLVNHIQDFYVSFPPHLYNNVFLYRKLFQYFKANNFLAENFSEFLRRKDEEIFKRIFDHQKHKKGSLLKEVKPIYQELNQGDKFNNSLLKFFSCDLSQVSDIKYLLNRINNQKREFHAQNEEMYEVLIKGMQINLKIGSQRDIPIQQVLIYITKIPIQENSLISGDLQVLTQLNEKSLNSLFKQMKINMSVFEIIRNRDTVLIKVIQHLIKKTDLSSHLNETFIVEFSLKTMKLMSDIRQKVYGSFNDNDLVFMYLAILMENAATFPFLHKVIQSLNNQEGVTTPFSKNQLQAAVYYSYRKKNCERPHYVDNEVYLSEIITLLDQDSNLRIFISTQLELARMFTAAGLQMIYPICGEAGVISKRIIQGLIDLLSGQGLLTLNIETLYKLQLTLLKCIGMPQNSVSLYELYEKQIVCLMNKKHLRQALQKMQILFEVDPNHPDNIIYLVLMFRQISCELIEENKQLMLRLISKLFMYPDQLLSFFKELTSKCYSNDQQKQLLMGKIYGGLTTADSSFSPSNILFDQVFKQFLKQKPQKYKETETLLQHQFVHFVNSNFHEYVKSIDLPIIHMITLQRPQLLIKYINRSITFINLREVRCYLSYLSKYELFDCFRVLQFGKRVFKVLYLCEKDAVNLDSLVTQNFATPLSELDNLSFLPSDTQNLNKLSKCVQKFRSKLKTKLNSSSMLKKKRASTIQQSLEQKYAKLELLLSDHSIYLSSYEYPFNDSDKQIEKHEVIAFFAYQQLTKPGVFNFKKYLAWMLKRTNQPIEYYLIKANEAQVDLQMKRRQEALKMSFRRYPSDKYIKQNAPLILGALQKIEKVQKGEYQPQQRRELAPEGMKNLPFLSAIPIVQGSAISELDINPTEIQQVEEVCLGTSILKDEILASIKRSSQGKLTFDVELIRNYGSSYKLEQTLPEVLKEIYQDEKVSLTTVLELFIEIQVKFSKFTQINNDFLQIYKKIDHLHRKVSLQVPIRLLLPFEGLLLKDSDSSALFYFIKEGIRKQLTQTNILTISKIIALAFKRQDLNFQQVLKAEFMKSSNIVI